jgi:serine/threonine-protein kinase
LKYLPRRLVRDAGALARFHSEVRTARQVSHPNVCRVFDIGESDGEHFLSMEYVDGEDFASLLRRIGRLPPDKAVDIARQLCAGLSAAHSVGVLHRDLKPANVMLDGRGRVRITDFGLAIDASRTPNAPSFAGTPAYVSPEQATADRLTTASDIYSLGLVLYEIFTGRRPFAGTTGELLRAHRDSAPVTPSSHVRDLDPQIERIILACLEKDPRNRPASAALVAAGLTGGDPLQEAIAAGETPSPEMVAAAGRQVGMSPAIAAACLIAVVASAGLVLTLGRHTSVFSAAPPEDSPEILRRKARDISAAVGYPQRPAGPNGTGCAHSAPSPICRASSNEWALQGIGTGTDLRKVGTSRLAAPLRKDGICKRPLASMPLAGKDPKPVLMRQLAREQAREHTGIV